MFAGCVLLGSHRSSPTSMTRLWTPLPSIVEHIESRIGPCVCLSDGWAWLVDARTGRGWSGHRGWTSLLRDVDGRPQLINVWLALTDVTTSHSRITLVPRSLDPHYPRALEEAPDERLCKAISVRAGQAIYWDANVFHWGSEAHGVASTPRISVSYTVASRNVADQVGETTSSWPTSTNASTTSLGGCSRTQTQKADSILC